MMRDKVVAIIGGSRGIGKELVSALRDDFSISTCSRVMEEAKGDNFISCQCDMRQVGSVKDFVLKTMKKSIWIPKKSLILKAMTK